MKKNEITPEEVYPNTNAEAEGTLKNRLIGMTLGLFLAHVYVALALYYTSIDDKGYFHTSWLALFGTFVSSMIFCYHIGISKVISEKNNGIYGRYFSPLISPSLWGFVLIVIAVLSVFQWQPWFMPYSVWAWPLTFASIMIGYFIGPVFDRMFVTLGRFSRRA
ncbi:hypothetical protein [Gluconobacter japonicus]|uniref:Uncharacterized protein n=1 Tax=Gluconobacter japonicus TaxID=376620 RepID=A0ABQ5WEY2_GLUJA|nr:hypothetical protein [Gluconobacter japonicus]KXV30118.1 hypothetical protein AD938_00375 [Gluconobacter japonicus]GLQ58268.1 hypothetical protein GCM10010937_00690 [Gluconobacter japonicus]